MPLLTEYDVYPCHDRGGRSVSSADGPGQPVRVDSPALERWPTFALDHDIEAVEDDGLRCTIRPSDAADDDRNAAWIAATGDGFADLDEIR
jgi:hypothetical protein